jgi:polysaccharide export outer membrane protein
MKLLMFRRFSLSLLVLQLAACSSPVPQLPTPGSMLEHDKVQEYASPAEVAAALEAFEAAGSRQLQNGYILTPGDEVTISVFERPELSSTQRVGPDGLITLPVVGDVLIGGLSRSAALTRVRDAFHPSYPQVSITLRIEEYRAYQIVVLGSVTAPGEYSFDSPPTLLRVLGQARGLLANAKDVLPERCAIMRGQDAVLWVDLNQLMREGDMSLNVDLIPGDIIHIPEESQALFYVLGEVANPGIYPLRRGSTTLDAIAMAGGTLISSVDEEVRLLRPRGNSVDGFDYEEFSEGADLSTMALAAGDVVYVPRRTLAEIGWIFQQVAPFTSLLFTYQIAQDRQ